jgi:hypothetical protein
MLLIWSDPSRNGRFAVGLNHGEAVFWDRNSKAISRSGEPLQTAVGTPGGEALEISRPDGGTVCARGLRHEQH